MQDELQALLAKAAHAATAAMGALASALGTGAAPGLLQHRLACSPSDPSHQAA